MFDMGDLYMAPEVGMPEGKRASPPHQISNLVNAIPFGAGGAPDVRSSEVRKNAEVREGTAGGTGVPLAVGTVEAPGISENAGASGTIVAHRVFR